MRARRAQPGVRRLLPFSHAVGGRAGCADPGSRTAGRGLGIGRVRFWWRCRWRGMHSDKPGGSSPRRRVPWTLTPNLSRVHPGVVHRVSFRGRGGPRGAEPRVSHRSDSPTPARRVGGLRPRKETRESREESFWRESVARLGPNLEYGAFRRLGMRSAAARGGDCGLPHGGTLPRGVVEPRRAAWGAVLLASRPRVARLHQPADAGPSAWGHGCAAELGVRRLPPFSHAVAGRAGCAGPGSRTARWSPRWRRNTYPQ
jgi:hypothetical protein